MFEMMRLELQCTIDQYEAMINVQVTHRFVSIGSRVRGFP